MNWWEEGHDCYAYPHICIWMKGKLGVREVYNPEEDSWFYLNPETRLAYNLGEGYEEEHWNPLQESRLDMIKKQPSYLGIIYIIDWHHTIDKHDNESIWSTFRPCGDIDPGFGGFIEDYPLVTRESTRGQEKVKKILQQYVSVLDDHSEQIPEGLYLTLMDMNKKLYEINV